MIQNKWQTPIDVPVPPEDSSTLFHNAENGGVLSIKLSNGNVVPVGGGGLVFMPVTYPVLSGMISTSSLTPGVTYHITDKDFFFQAFLPNELSPFGTRKMRILKPNIYEDIDIIYPGISLSINDIVIWGGKVWEVTGTPTTIVDYPFDYADPNLNNEGVVFTLIANTNDTYYEDKFFGFIWNAVSDRRHQQSDEKGNVVTASEDSYGNYIDYFDITDWGNAKVRENRVVGGIVNVSEAVGNMMLGGSIYSVTKSSVRYNVSQLGHIYMITNDSNIQYNSFCGDIYAITACTIEDNKCPSIWNGNAAFLAYNILSRYISNFSNATITHNRNTGEIVGVNGVDVYSNTNNGSISATSVHAGNEVRSCANNGSVYVTFGAGSVGVRNCINNGYISNGNNPVTANITDTVVHK